MAEARAALMAIRLCKNRGIERIIFERDAKAVINAVQIAEIDGSCLSVIVADIQGEMQSFQQWRLAFVRRKGNAVAHCLSKAATKHLIDQSWFSEIPDCVVNVL